MKRHSKKIKPGDLMTELQDKPDTDENAFAECFTWAITQLKEIKAKVEELDGKKREIILELARKLDERGMPKDMISEEICKHLRTYISIRYVQGCLKHEYKNQKKSTRRLANTSSIEDKKVLAEISNTGEKRQKLRQHNPDVEINELQELVEAQRRRIYELEQIEKERIKQTDYKSAALLVRDELQTKIEGLEKRVKEQDTLLARTRFQGTLELKDNVIPLIILIDRVNDVADVRVNTSKMKST